MTVYHSKMLARTVLLTTVVPPCLALELTPGAAHLLDVGVKTIYINDTSANNQDTLRSFNPASGQRVSVWFWPGAKRPVKGTQSACADPCTIDFDRSFGNLYLWYEYVDSTGASLNPAQKSQYHTIAPVAPAATSTLEIPVEVKGGEGYQTPPYQFTVAAGQATTGLRLWMYLHNVVTTTEAEYRINSGSWIAMNNSTCPASDTRRGYGGFGGPLTLFEAICTISDGTIVTGTNTIQWRFLTAYNRSHGYMIIRWNIIEADKELSQIVVGASSASTMTTAAQTWATNEWVIVRNAPGMWRRFCGLRQLTSVPNTTTAVFTSTADPGAANTPTGTYTLPTSRWPSNYDSPKMYAARALIANTSFTFIDPSVHSNYLTITNDAGRLASGGTAYNSLTFMKTSDPRWDYNFGDKGVGCTTCHTVDGRDFSFYGYSNQAIKAAVMKSGGTLTQAENLTSWIRTRGIARGSGAWPFNPPYQPCPGRSTVTLYDYAAGCGFDAVLNYDKDLAEYMFPAGSSTHWAYDQALIKAEDIPVPFSGYPWNNWIPVQPPKLFDSNFDTSQPKQNRYDSYRTTLAGSSADCTKYHNANTAFSQFYSDIFTYKLALYGDWASKIAGHSNPVYAEGLWGLNQWGLMKMWELMNEFNLQECHNEEFTTIYGVSTYGYKDRGWARSNHLFNAAFHKSNTCLSCPTPMRGTANPFFFVQSHIWYVMTPVLGHGNRRDTGDSWIDWPYTDAFARDAGNEATVNPGFPNIYYIFFNAMINGQAVADNAATSAVVPFIIRKPSSMLDATNKLNFLHVTDSELGTLLTHYIQNAVLPYVKTRYTLTQWNTDLLPRFQPAACTSGIISASQGYFQSDGWCHQWAYALPMLRHFGVSTALLDDLRTNWLDDVWPNYDWVSAQAATCSPTTYGDPNGATFNWPQCSNWNWTGNSP